MDITKLKKVEIDEKPETGTKLRRCPFCNGKAVAYHNDYGGDVDYWVGCSDCGASTEMCTNAEDAADMWNKRFNAPNIEFEKICDVLEGISNEIRKHFNFYWSNDGNVADSYERGICVGLNIVYMIVRKRIEGKELE